TIVIRTTLEGVIFALAHSILTSQFLKSDIDSGTSIFLAMAALR
ncbi:unnamed protein product, partial [Heterotrigona itama]